MADFFKHHWKGFEHRSKSVRTALAFLGALALVGASAQAQPFDLEPLPRAAMGYVLVESAAADVVITLDGEPVASESVTGGRLVGPLPVGEAALALWPDGRDAWNARRADARVAVRPADTVLVQLRIPARTLVTSVPYGARVSLIEEGQPPVFLGTTPLAHDSATPLAGTLLIEQDGYAAERLVPGGTFTERHAVLLAPMADPALAAAPGVYTYGDARVRGRRWIDYAAAGLAVAGAATSIYYKFEADRIDDRIRDQVDTLERTAELEDRRRRLDGSALVGLGAMQLGVGVLAVRFVLR